MPHGGQELIGLQLAFEQKVIIAVQRYKFGVGNGGGNIARSIADRSGADRSGILAHRFNSEARFILVHRGL